MPPSSINWHKQKAPQEDGIKMHTFFLIIIIIFLFLLWSFLSLLVIYSQLEMALRGAERLHLLGRPRRHRYQEDILLSVGQMMKIGTARRTMSTRVVVVVVII